MAAGIECLTRRDLLKGAAFVGGALVANAAMVDRSNAFGRSMQAMVREDNAERRIMYGLSPDKKAEAVAVRDESKREMDAQDKRMERDTCVAVAGIVASGIGAIALARSLRSGFSG